MHAHVQAGQEPLADRSEGRFCRGHDASHGAVVLGEDEFAEAENAELHQPAIDLRRLEHLQDERHLARLREGGAHVGIHHLNVVTARKTQGIQLVARLTLGLEVRRAYQQRVPTRQELDDLQVLIGQLVPMLPISRRAVSHQGRRVAQSEILLQLDRLELVHGRVLHEVRNRFPRCLAVEVEGQVHGPFSVHLEQLQERLVVVLVSLIFIGLAEGLMRDDQLADLRVAVEVLHEVSRLVPLDFWDHSQNLMVPNRAGDRLRHGLRPHGRPEPNLHDVIGRRRSGDEIQEQLSGTRAELRCQVVPLSWILRDDEGQVALHTVLVDQRLLGVDDGLVEGRDDLRQRREAADAAFEEPFRGVDALLQQGLERDREEAEQLRGGRREGVEPQVRITGVKIFAPLLDEERAHFGKPRQSISVGHLSRFLLANQHLLLTVMCFSLQ
mmetsp:Transcript_60766/g.198974  ORF Transcript_60766/g.198974 Transcript_60766/m.198974 type:complete len:440 (-) Transcript_60766:4183-5502(-)